MKCLNVRLLALCAIFAATPAVAQQDYPNRPITLVVPYAAGGGNDVMARSVAEKMSKALGQNIVVENRAGAGGSIATRQVARAAPDGYTLVLGGTGTLAVNPTTLRERRLRPPQGFRAGRADRHGATHSRDQSQRAGKNRPRVDRVGKEGTGQAQLRLSRCRQRHPSRRRAVRDDGRNPARSRALQRHRTCADRPDRRPRADLFLVAPGRSQPRQGRQGTRTRCRQDRSARRSSRTCPRSPKRCPGSKPSCTTGSLRRPARPTRSSASSTSHCVMR